MTKVKRKYQSLQAVQADLFNNKIQLVELVNYYLNQIEATKELNAYVEVYAEEAQKRALELEQNFKRKPDSVGKLFGVSYSCNKHL